MAPLRKRIRMMYEAAENLTLVLGIGDDNAEGDAELSFLCAILDLYTPPLALPRTVYVQADYPAESLWKSIRESRRESAL